MEYDAVIAAMTRVLAPVLGESMARASAQAHGAKLALANGRITAEQAGTLVGKLNSGLIVFVGRDRAAALAEDMRAAVAALGEGP
ncbi:MAG: hypothetical protein ABW221_17620 [Vicinamibacteria bacterium]